MQVTVPVVLVALAREPVMYRAGRVKTMVDPIMRGLVGVNPRVRVPVVVTPGILSVVAEAADAAAAATAPPAAGSAAGDETAVTTPMTPPALAIPCTVKVPLTKLEVILHPEVRTRLNAVVIVSAVAIEHVILVKPADPVAGGQAGAGPKSAVVQVPIVVPAPPVVYGADVALMY